MSVLLSACGVSNRDALRTNPDEGLTREAYLDTPLIDDNQGREIDERTTRGALSKKLGRSQIVYPRGGLACVLYPIRGTERRDDFGSPIADEWEFCFSDSNHLRMRSRISSRRTG